MKLSRPLLGVLAVAAVLSLGGVASGRDDHDHEAARAALARGEILPLTRILTLVAQQAPGDILEIELERDHARFVYEVRVLTPAGKVVEVKLDARTGARLEDDKVSKPAKADKPDKVEAAREKAEADREKARETRRDARADRRR